MRFDRYHKTFHRRRKACLEHAKKLCQHCGAKHRSIAFTAEAEVYILYLHAAHVFADDKANPNAPLMALCPKCHYAYDHPKTMADWWFIGTVYQWFIEEKGVIYAEESLCEDRQT